MSQSTSLHTYKDAEHLTPAKYVEAARTVLDTIDLVPASCATANDAVRAARYYGTVANGLSWPRGGFVFCNPPRDLRLHVIGRRLQLKDGER